MLSACVVALVRLVAPELPAPSGPSPVGTVVAYLRDEARSAADASARSITLQLWYPAASATSGERVAPYLMEPGLAEVLVSQSYCDVDAAELRAWEKLATHARVAAEPSAGAHPLLTFSVGLGVARASYTTLAEELASHGTVVALVESPGAGVMLRDGHALLATSPDLETPAGHRAAVDEWARDVRFALDLMAKRGFEGGGLEQAAARVAASIDWKCVAAAGHSSGGLVAIQSAVLDERVRAAIDLDGGFVSPEGEAIADFVATGPSKPTLVLLMNPRYGEADFARRGLTREQWEERGAAGRTAQAELVARSPAPLVFVRVAGTGHFSFSDGPFVMPGTLTRFGGDLLEPGRNRLVITTIVRAFLEETLAAHAGRFDEVAGQLPELEVVGRSAGKR